VFIDPPAYIDYVLSEFAFGLHCRR
jgi:hypothetical protein